VAARTNGTSAEAAVQALARGADIELIPLRSAEEKLRGVPAGSTVTVTCSAKLGLDRTLDFAGQAARAGYNVVPHLAARQLTDKDDLRRFIGRLAELEITELYLIGGDATPPAGPFDSSFQVLQALQGIEHGLRRIGVACYPEGHPHIPDDALLEALQEKQPYSAYMVSQLCFSPGTLVSWLRRVRETGISLPLHLGLAAPMQVRKLLELGPRIGVGASVRYLAKQRGFVGTMLKGGAYQPEKLLLQMGDALTSRELGIERLHLFSFNQVDATVDWQRRIAGGAQAEPATGAGRS
jgi:methylenetetrahydrofolate reductase (NADPH)